MKIKPLIALLMLTIGLILISGCTRQDLPANNEPDDVSVRVEEPVITPEDSDIEKGEGESQVSVPAKTVETFTEAAEFKEELSSFLEGEFETVNTGLGIVDRADIGTGYVEVKRFENGLLGSISFNVPYDAQAPENTLKELADYAAILTKTEFGDEQLKKLTEAAATCTVTDMTEPVQVQFGEMYLFLIYNKETGYIGLSK